MSSLQLTKDRVRSFGGYNTLKAEHIYETIYRARGHAENLIKQHKHTAASSTQAICRAWRAQNGRACLAKTRLQIMRSRAKLLCAP